MATSSNSEVKKEVEKPPTESSSSNDYDPSWLKGTSAEKVINQRPRKDFSDPAYKKLSKLNGKVNTMSMTELKKALGELELDINGEKEVLKKRLKNHYKEINLRSPKVTKQCKFDYVCVIDFEATCTATQQNDYPHEIIEFPLVLVNIKTLTIEDSVSWYCKPIINPKLTKFCTELTGITQEQVDEADEFPKVLDKVKGWLKERDLLGAKYKLAVATDGPWDMQNFLNLQCSLAKIDYPRWARKWVDIRKLFANYLGVRRCGIAKMLAYYGYEFEGNQHCGLDDAKNIARILVRLAKDGCNVHINSHIKKCLSQIEKPSENHGSNDDSELSAAESLEFPEE